MNKKIKLYIFLLLFSLSEQKIQTSPLSAKLSIFNNIQFLKTVSFTDIQKIIYDNPKLSIFIAICISLIGCKKIFFSRNKNQLDTTFPSKAEFHYSADASNTTLILTPHNKKEPYCYNNLQSYEASPLGNYILAHQLNETSIGSAFSQALFSGLGASSIIQNLLRCSSLYHIIDIKTGTILSLENAQQCTFSANEKYLLIREVKSIGKLNKFLSLFKKTQSLQAHKDTSCIQYRIIDLTTKKTIIIFNDIFSATFYNDDHLRIIKSNGNIKYFKPHTISSFNPFTHKIQYIEYEELSPPSFIPIKFYFDNSAQTYCIDIEIPQQPTQTIQHVKTYYQYNNQYLLINTDQNYKTIKSLLSDVTYRILLDSIQSIINVLKKPTFLTQLKNLSTGNTLFTYHKPIICTLTPKNTIFIAEITPENTINYKAFDFNDSSTGFYDNGIAITFLNSNEYTVLDENNVPCTLIKTTLSSAIVESTREITNKTKNFVENALAIWIQDIQEKGQNICDHISNDLNNLVENTIPEPKKATIPNNIISIQNDHTITYNKYVFNYKKSQKSNNSTTNYQQLLKENIHGLEWNIYIFNSNLFKTICNRLDGYSLFTHNNKICISHLEPHLMQYHQYQSLKSELEKVIDYMKKNTQAIINIVLLTNDCSLQQIDNEITTILEDKKYNPLLSPAYLKEQQKDLTKLTIGEMIQANKRLLFFSDKQPDITQPDIITITHPKTSISTNILQV